MYYEGIFSYEGKNTPTLLIPSGHKNWRKPQKILCWIVPFKQKSYIVMQKRHLKLI